MLAQRDKHADAVAEYSEAIRLAPGNPDNLNDRGWSLIKIEQYDKAIADFNEALRIKPDHVHAWQNRGWAYWLKGDLDKALADLDRGGQPRPGQSSTPRLDRAAVLDDKGDFRPLDRRLRQDPSRGAGRGQGAERPRLGLCAEGRAGKGAGRC